MVLKGVILTEPEGVVVHKPQAVMGGRLGLACLQAEVLVLSDREDKVDFGKRLLVVAVAAAFMAVAAVEMMVVALVPMAAAAAEADLH
jgi:hypothetical protein